ncbi:MAG: heavy-metal-associated domain-containing protein [Candidatus Kapaibacterium sp.]
MKKMLTRIVAIAMIGMLTFAVAAIGQGNPDMMESKFKTSAYSFMCKNQIESAVNDIEGVDNAFLDMDTKVLSVTYHNGKVTDEKICKTVADLGYECEKLPAQSK